MSFSRSISSIEAIEAIEVHFRTFSLNPRAAKQTEQTEPIEASMARTLHHFIHTHTHNLHILTFSIFTFSIFTFSLNPPRQEELFAFYRGLPAWHHEVPDRAGMSFLRSIDL